MPWTFRDTWNSVLWCGMKRVEKSLQTCINVTCIKNKFRRARTSCWFKWSKSAFLYKRNWPSMPLWYQVLARPSVKKLCKARTRFCGVNRKLFAPTVSNSYQRVPFPKHLSRDNDNETNIMPQTDWIITENKTFANYWLLIINSLALIFLHVYKQVNYWTFSNNEVKLWNVDDRPVSTVVRLVAAPIFCLCIKKSQVGAVDRLISQRTHLNCAHSLQITHDVTAYMSVWLVGGY